MNIAGLTSKARMPCRGPKPREPGASYNATSGCAGCTPWTLCETRMVKHKGRVPALATAIKYMDVFYCQVNNRRDGLLRSGFIGPIHPNTHTARSDYSIKTVPNPPS